MSDCMKNVKVSGLSGPDNCRYVNDIYIPSGREMGAVTGHKVVVEMTSYGGGTYETGRKSYADHRTCERSGTDILSIVMDLGIRQSFPRKF